MKNPNKKKSYSNVTIYDISEIAGVSAATVSRALNNKGSISKKTVNKIKDIATKLNYYPNRVARMLKEKLTNQIMLSMPDTYNEFYFDIISEVNKYCKKKGYSLLLNYHETDQEIIFKMLDNLNGNFIDALILISVDINTGLINRMNKTKRPIVLSNVSSPPPAIYKGNYDFIGVDTCTAMYLSVKHLIENGYRRIGYIGLSLDSMLGRERLSGYKLALEQFNISIDPSIIYTKGYKEIVGYKCALDMLKNKNTPTAISTCNDVLALGVYRAFDEMNINIPKDISVVGMDDSNVCKIVKPKMSSVSLCPKEIGQISAKLALDRVENQEKSYESVLLKPKLFIRESSIIKHKERYLEIKY